MGLASEVVGHALASVGSLVEVRVRGARSIALTASRIFAGPIGRVTLVIANPVFLIDSGGEFPIEMN